MIIANYLINQNATIKAYDPQAMHNAKKNLPQLICCDSINDTCKDADAVIIATEWNEFRALDLRELKKILKSAIIFDLRNIYNKENTLNLGYEYYGVGR